MNIDDCATTEPGPCRNGGQCEDGVRTDEIALTPKPVTDRQTDGWMDHLIHMCVRTKQYALGYNGRVWFKRKLSCNRSTNTSAPAHPDITDVNAKWKSMNAIHFLVKMEEVAMT